MSGGTNQTFWQFLVALPGAIWKRIQQIDWSTLPIADILISGGAGLLGGFLLRRYFHIILILFVIVAACAIWLDYTDILKLDWRYIAQTIGFSHQNTFASFGSFIIGLIYSNMVRFTASVIGFLLGFTLL